MLAGLLVPLACGGGAPPHDHVEVAGSVVRDDPTAVAAVDGALELLVSGDRAGAHAALTAALDRHPDSYEALLEHARLGAALGDTAPALATYQRLFLADPADVPVARGLARLALFLGRVDLAGPAADALAGPDAAAGDLALAAEVALAAGDVELARTRAEEATRVDPKHPDGHHQLALALLEGAALGGPDATATDQVQVALRKAIHQDPGRVEARHLLGTLLLQGDAEARGTRLLDSIELVRELEDPAFAAGDPAERIQRARAIGVELPGWSRPQLEVARAQLALGQPVKADATLAEAMAKRPRLLELYKLRYAAALARGDTKAERNWLERWTEQRSQDD